MKINYRKISFLLLTVVVLFIAFFLLVDKVIMPSYTQQGKTTKVPSLIGLKYDEAKIQIINAGLKPMIAEYKSDKNYEIGTIIFQNPVAGTEVKYGRGVYLTISGGEEYVFVPNLKGKTIREATFNLEQVGLQIGTISYESSEEIFANTIIRQEIPPQTRVKSGTKINIIVSQGRTTDTYIVPDVTFRTVTEAEKKIRENGFQVGRITYQVNLDVLPNTVLEQYPHGGSTATLGQAIDLIVSQKIDQKTKIEH